MTYDWREDSKHSYDEWCRVKRAEGIKDGSIIPWRRKEVIGDATLYLGDCLGVMPTLERVDAVVTDPPYGIGYKPQRHNSTASKGDRNFGPEDQLAEDSGKLDFDPRPFLKLSDNHI